MAISESDGGRELHLHEPDGPVTAVALVLHGGRATSTEPASERNLAVLRMRPIASHLARAGAAHGLAVARLRYAVRGWNAESRSPVPDTRWALRRLHERLGAVPTALVGHSMGGRVATYVADHPTVTTVVELAPWVEPGDPVQTMADRSLLVVHGALDKMTSPRRSAEFVRAVQGIANDARYVTLRNTAHAILGRARLANELTTGFVLEHLYGVEPTGAVGEVLHGQDISATI